MSLHRALIISLGLASIPLSYAFNDPTGVDIWCGKAYRATNAYFNPGGWMEDPPMSSDLLLDLKIRPSMSLYLESDTAGSLLVDASTSHLVGRPYSAGNNSTSPSSTKIDIHITASNSTIHFAKATSVEVNSLNNEIPIELDHFAPSLTQYNITIKVSPYHSNGTIYTATTQLIRLPQRTDGGSVTRLDHLYGGLSVLKGNETDWSLIFPYTYYVQWSLYWYANLSTLDEFASMGYNVIHIVPTGDLGDSPFPWEEIELYLTRADELGLHLQYNVRWDPTNLTEMVDQISRLRSHPSVLLWYTGDEPDGKGDAINSTRVAYDTVRSLNPYHPVSLALKCYNFYYSDYASGAEIIISDVYPVSTNTSWSTVYETPCNSTYGCCGCDDCNGAFEDISDRLDDFAHLDDIIGWPKTHWSAPQAFGNETFWTRYPTAAEEVVMIMLSINHAAKGIVMWDFPTSASILNVTNRLVGILTTAEISDLFLGTPLTQTLTVSGALRVDAAAWVGESKMLLSIVNLNYGNLEGNVTINLPSGVIAKLVPQKLWGETDWKTGSSKVSAAGILGLGVSLLVVDLV